MIRNHETNFTLKFKVKVTKFKNEKEMLKICQLFKVALSFSLYEICTLNEVHSVS